MCEIQIIKRLNGKINEDDIAEFYKMMCFGSMHNCDASGLFNENYSFKQGGKFSSEGIKTSELMKSKFIVGHNRFATDSFKGMLISTVSYHLDAINYLAFKPTLEYKEYKSKKENYKVINHHPFELGDFILVHNGIIDNAEELQKKLNILTDIKTDSYVILQLINLYFNRFTEGDRITRISKAIKKTCKDISGTYSVVLYDKISKKVFYFKDFWTDFYFCKIGNVLVGSTAEKNLDYIYFGKDKRELIYPNPDKIYILGNNKKEPLIEVGEFETRLKLMKQKKKNNKQSILRDILTIAFPFLGFFRGRNMKGGVD